MKKFIIPVIIMIAIFVGSAIFAVYLNYTVVQYEKDLLWHIMTLEEEGGELTAEYDGQTVRVLGNNIIRISKIVSVYERKHIFKEPVYDEDKAVFLHFSDGAEFVVFEDTQEDDAVYIIYTYKKKELFFHVQGYNSWSWLQKAISPEGISSPNEVIN